MAPRITNSNSGTELQLFTREAPSKFFESPELQLAIRVPPFGSLIVIRIPIRNHEAILCGMNQRLMLPIRVPIWQPICYNDSYLKNHEAILCGMNQWLRLPIRVPIWQPICYKDSYKKSWNNALWNDSRTKSAYIGAYLVANCYKGFSCKFCFSGVYL